MKKNDIQMNIIEEQSLTEELLILEQEIGECDFSEELQEVLEEEIEEVLEDELEDAGDNLSNQTEDYFIEDSMKAYMRQCSQIPLLTAEEERELGKVIQEGGSKALEARNKLIQANLRLVINCAKKYLRKGMELADLNSMGTMGLFIAADKYDYKRGYKFSTYAYWWIKQSIARGVAAEENSIRIPVHMLDKIQKINRVKKDFMQENGHEPSIEELAEHSGLTESTVKSTLGSMHNVVSIDTKVGKDENVSIENFIADENAVNPSESAERKALRETIAELFAWLEPKEALVLIYRHGFIDNVPRTLEEIANMPEFGVTRERIRQIEQHAYEKVKRSSRLCKALLDFVA